jgi:hypothetical protein
MDRELEYLVSNYDIENQFDHSKNIKILLYSDLNDINELTTHTNQNHRGLRGVNVCVYRPSTFRLFRLLYSFKNI